MSETPDTHSLPCSQCGGEEGDHFEGCALVTLPPCEDCGSDTVDHYVGCALDGVVAPLFEEEPEVIEEAEGSWIFVPNGDLPSEADAVGIRAHQVRLRCRWQHRHIADREPMPQPCCYSVLVTTSRLPGPAHTVERSWLSMDDHDEASQAVTPDTTEGTES